MGLDRLCVLRFGTAIRNLTADQFAHLLAERLQPAIVVVGHDFRFGRHGQGRGSLYAPVNGSGSRSISWSL